MSLFPGTNSTYFGKARREHSDSSQIPVKTEESPSPDLVQTSHPPAQDLRYPFSSQSSTSHASASVPNTEQPSQLLDHQSAAYSFSSNPTTSAYTLVPPVSTSQWTTAQMDSKYDLSLEGAMSFNDEYDDVGDLMDLQSIGGAGGGLGSMGGSDKPVRRRSSKACDQCRKSKCKCERSSPDEPCRSCVLLGTTCTFLGPSRKRGPPKGYIDAIEARLHQTEALLGIMISSADERAQSLLKDISQDPLAREIITRVDHSPYGVKGRKGGDEKTAGPSKSRHLTSDQRSQDKSELSSTHPSNEWQDKVVHMLSLMSSRNGLGRTQDTGAEQSSQGGRTGRQPATIVTAVPMARSVSHPHPEPGASSRHGSTSPGRRLRRRIDPAESSYPTHSSSAPPSATFPPVGFGFTSPGRAPYGQLSPPLRGSNSDFDKTSSQPTRSTSPALSYSSDSDTEDLSGAVGQLSLNEEEEVRYHGKASGLYLLHNTDRRDSRNEGGIWRFPKARVWPALQSGSPSINMEDEDTSALPALPVQERLLDLYFTHVHPSFPVLHKQAFLESFKAGAESPASLSDVDVSHSSPFTRRSRRIPHVLLLTMFSIAARYSPDTTSPRPIDKSVMWEAGDDFLGQAKRILDTTYANSRPTTCQALLLLGYREIGIGAMAQAWIYTGMAIRMAQDLGMHRSADGWARQELGGRLFSQWELQSRRRIWYTCVVMDKYVSSYIGRPLSIFERDFDTLVPSEEESEELEEWISFTHDADDIPRRPSRIISCFNASASLSGIISMIIQAIYAVRPVSRRHGESVFLEGILDKWLVALPDHLQHDPGSAKYPVPLPHVLTLHMQYWCAVLLLHRPFMRLNSRHLVDGENRNSAQKAYELCVGAANHITSIATLYQSTYTLKGAAAFLCYYVFTASLMHVTSMSAHPGNPQAAFRLNKCVEILENMEVLWPSAGRARQLLQGAEINTAPKTELPAPERFKRAAEHSLNDTSMDIAPSRVPPISNFSSRHSSYNHQPGANQLPSNMFGSDGIPMRYASGSQYPPFERQWSSDYPAGQNAYSVSTSPLPQMYSTGLALERRSSGSTAANPRFSQQYWNDYTAYTPGGYHAPPPPLQNNPSSQDPLHHMFMSDPYHVYSKPS